MIALALAFLLLALILILGSTLWLGILASRRQFFWNAWAKTKRPLVIGVVGIGVALVAFFLFPREEFKAKFSRLTQLLRSSKTAGESVPELSLEERQARLVAREKELLARKAALNAGDRLAVEALTREIAQYNSELQSLMLALNQRKAGDGLWREEAVGAPIPKEPVAGRVHGRPFSYESANLENGILSLRQGREFVAEQEWVIFLFLKKSESPANRLIEVKRKAGSSAAHVHLKWREKGSELPKSMIFTDNYTMQLRFGPEENGKVEGEIYVCLPDPEKSYAAGSFRAVLTGR